MAKKWVYDREEINEADDKEYPQTNTIHVKIAPQAVFLSLSL